MTRSMVDDLVRKHILPLMLEAIETVNRMHSESRHFDNMSYGYTLYRHFYNALTEMVDAGGTPFKRMPGSDGVLTCGDFHIRVHRGDHKTQLPRGARGAKSRAVEQMELEGVLDPPAIIRELLLAAIVEPGDKEVSAILLGPLIKLPSGKVQWQMDQVTNFIDAPVAVHTPKTPRRANSPVEDGTVDSIAKLNPVKARKSKKIG